MINVTKTDLPEKEEYTKYLNDLWSSRWITNDGEFVRSLEKKLEEYLNVKNLLVVSNGTLALQIALNSLEIKNEVITTPFTFAATTNVILWEKLNPIFADIDPETFNIDPEDVKKKITNKTGAILAVHVYGNPCYVEELQEIANENNIKLIFDAAHAFGVEYNNKSVLKYGDLSTLSFHATKIFNTIEGGAITVKNDDIYDKIKLLRNHGISSEENVLIPGINAKMNEFQAIMGLCNLKSIDDKIKTRREYYEYYKYQLEKLNKEIKFQKIVATRYNYSYLPVCFKNKNTRDKIYIELLKKGIHARKYFYPLTVNYDYFKNKNLDLVKTYQLDNAVKISNGILCLPLYSDLKLKNIDKIINCIKNTI